MLKEYNRYKVLKVFLDSPTESFGLRELSRASGIAPVSVLNYLKEFEREKLIVRKIIKGVPAYIANRDNENFIVNKKIGILYELSNSGLVEELWQKLSPNAIVLYGSFARGEAVEGSDVDIFIIGKEKRIKLESFEKNLGKKIHLMFEENVKMISRELKNNLINGIVLKGYIKVF
jgi:predicted nucleotidyltransferase